MAADYGMITLELNINPDASTANIARDFAIEGQKMMKSVNDLLNATPGGPYEIVSHDFVPVGYKLLGTFITRKVEAQ